MCRRDPRPNAAHLLSCPALGSQHRLSAVTKVVGEVGMRGPHPGFPEGVSLNRDKPCLVFDVGAIKGIWPTGVNLPRGALDNHGVLAGYVVGHSDHAHGCNRRLAAPSYTVSWAFSA